MKKERPKPIISGHFMMVDGIKTEIEPLKTNLPDRCKLIMAELLTGNKYEVVKG